MARSESKRVNASLIIGLSIPVLMVIFIVSAIQLPRWLNPADPPVFDYLYSVGWTTKISYSVENGRVILMVHDIKSTNAAGQEPRLFIYDVSTNNSREVSFDEAQNLLLDSSTVSPDGYRVETGHRPGWLFFDYPRDYRRRYLVKGYQSIEQSSNAEPSGYYYGSTFRLMGWIVNPAEEQHHGQ